LSDSLDDEFDVLLNFYSSRSWFELGSFTAFTKTCIKLSVTVATLSSPKFRPGRPGVETWTIDGFLKAVQAA